MIHLPYDEQPKHGSKRCKFFASSLKDAFTNCHTFSRRVSYSSEGEEYNPPLIDEQEVFVSAVLSRYLAAKARRKSRVTLESFCWEIDLPLTTKQNVCDFEGREDFFSVGSCFSRSSSSTNMEAFLSVKTNLSRCSSLNHVEYLDLHTRHSIIEEFCHCEGWPFGLCRKAVLLPPLPKSPSESWLSRKTKSSRTVK